METIMRSLKTEELELVAGGNHSQGAENSQSTKNNGLGNGDQGAPGGSLPNNGAENNVNGSSTGNPPSSGRWGVNPN